MSSVAKKAAVQAVDGSHELLREQNAHTQRGVMRIEDVNAAFDARNLIASRNSQECGSGGDGGPRQSGGTIFGCAVLLHDEHRVIGSG